MTTSNGDIPVFGVYFIFENTIAVDTADRIHIWVFVTCNVYVRQGDTPWIIKNSFILAFCTDEDYND
jgi:hypothetical protein